MRTLSKLGFLTTALVGTLALSSGAMAAHSEHHHSHHRHHHNKCHTPPCCPGKKHDTSSTQANISEPAHQSAIMTTYILRDVKIPEKKIKYFVDVTAQNAASTISPLLPGQDINLGSGVVFNKQAIDIISVIHNDYGKHGVKTETLDPTAIPALSYASESGPALGLEYGIIEYQKASLSGNGSTTTIAQGVLQSGAVMARDHSSIVKLVPTLKKGHYDIYVIGLDSPEK